MQAIGLKKTNLVDGRRNRRAAEAVKIRTSPPDRPLPCSITAGLCISNCCHFISVQMQGDKSRFAIDRFSRLNRKCSRP